MAGGAQDGGLPDRGKKELLSANQRRGGAGKHLKFEVEVVVDDDL